ncbi:glucuronate isomerase [[Clostridium] colinum]|uniref:glucuronate isomerase n=1 Tax=[Clostridium] colinum TaxID=36835 RepID=UPI0020249DF9|nr:glucuronate isomerase [[Clostridium] colinum]
MRKFMDEDFLLENEVAKKLYHNYAKKTPIFDYHCHLVPSEIAEDYEFDNLAKMWLYHDHYKWRAMRSFGIDEKYITGDADDYDKFYQFAKMMPYLIGNPIYHWTHLELKRFFGIEQTLSEKNAKEIWDKCNEIIKQEKLTAKKLIKMANVAYIGTTDDPIDDLKYHKQIKEDKDFNCTVNPTFRPDKAIKIKEKGFIQYINILAKVSNIDIKCFKDLESALEKRLDYFYENGCKISDHSLERINFYNFNEKEIDNIFIKALNEESINQEEASKYACALLISLGKMYHKRNMVMQLHIGALRNNNTRMFNKLGRDCGFDSIDDGEIAYTLSRILDHMEKDNKLPKTILYCLNPKDNEVIGSMIGNFQGDNIKGKIQFGSGWWFNDQKDGMERQMMALSQLGLISQFVGMVTDSRSFLSYVRHEYFRRILCNYIGTLVTTGQYPYDEEILGEIIENICFNNSKRYFS